MNEQIKQIMKEYSEFSLKLMKECMDISGVFDYKSYNEKMHKWIIEGIEKDLKRIIFNENNNST